MVTVVYEAVLLLILKVIVLLWVSVDASCQGALTKCNLHHTERSVYTPHTGTFRLESRPGR